MAQATSYADPTAPKRRILPQPYNEAGPFVPEGDVPQQDKPIPYGHDEPNVPPTYPHAPLPGVPSPTNPGPQGPMPLPSIPSPTNPGPQAPTGPVADSLVAPSAQPPTAPAPTAPTGSNPLSRTRQDNPMLARIADAMQSAWGRAPTDAEVNQWGSNIDEQYYQQILRTVYTTPEAVAFRASQATPAATTPPATGGTTDWATADYSNPATVAAYFQSRGVQMRPGSAEYWAQKYNSPEFNGDRAYFFQRLSTAEEFGGGGGQGAYASNPQSAYLDQIRQVLMDRIAHDSEPLSSSDPSIQEAMNGARLTAQRSGEMERRALSEQLFAGGDLNNGMKDQQVQQSGERTAASLSTLQGTLFMKEIDARRTDLTNLLNMAIQSGDAELARQTQIALANLQAMVQREGQGWAAGQYEVGTNANIPGGGN